MARFKANTTVEAFRIGADGTVIIDGSPRVGNAGAWVVIHDDGQMVTVPHDQFLMLYRPADDDAALYLASVMSFPVKN